MVTIGIIDDTRLESNEQFNCTLTLVTDDSSVRLDPAVAIITIIDSDSELTERHCNHLNTIHSTDVKLDKQSW